MHKVTFRLKPAELKPAKLKPAQKQDRKQDRNQDQAAARANRAASSISTSRPDGSTTLTVEETDMTTRTTSVTVVFHHPFVLAGLDEQQPAGTYQIETDEAQIEDVSVLAFRRIATVIHLHPTPGQPGIRQTMIVDPLDLDRALARDRETESTKPSRADAAEGS